jgi:hypothetical protein
MKTVKIQGARSIAYVPAVSQSAPKTKAKRSSARMVNTTKGKMPMEMSLVWISRTTLLTLPVRFFSSLAFW